MLKPLLLAFAALAAGSAHAEIQCWQFNNDPQDCARVSGCAYNYATNQCYDVAPTPPPPQPTLQTTTFECDSSHYRFNRCATPGPVVAAYLIQNVSILSCQQGNSWGYDSQGIWVSGGCRGVFQVTYEVY